MVSLVACCAGWAGGVGCATSVNVYSLGEGAYSYSQHGKTTCPDGANSDWKMSFQVEVRPRGCSRRGHINATAKC